MKNIAKTERNLVLDIPSQIQSIAYMFVVLFKGKIKLELYDKQLVTIWSQVPKLNSHRDRELRTPGCQLLTFQRDASRLPGKTFSPRQNWSEAYLAFKKFTYISSRQRNHFQL